MHFIGPLHQTNHPLVSRVLGRNRSIFADDLDVQRAAIRDTVCGSRVLVIGGAGSIGGSFVEQIVELGPRTLHIADLSENGLVELVRGLRSSSTRMPEDFRTFAVDLRQPEMLGLLAAHGPYDYVLNFAALKHVRSERDPFTLIRMLDTNVLSVRRLLETSNALPRFFSVSSDKAVRPANLMGASKALMERVMWLSGRDAITARFANVAFSAGSLLEGFGHRLAKGQPLAAPNDVRRYFISHEEAGQLCLLAAFDGRSGDVYVPAVEQVGEANTFSGIAEMVLAHHGYEALPCASEEEARIRAAERRHDEKTWPCFFSTSSTTGEKELEEFVGPTETGVDVPYRSVGVVRAGQFDGAAFGAAIDGIDAARREGRYDRAEIIELVARAIPEMSHQDTGHFLDSKM